MAKFDDLTYAELAQRYEVELCTGECAMRGHDDGFVRSRRLHFRERGVTRSGLRKFLMLVHDMNVWPLLRATPATAEEALATTRRSGKVETARWIHSRNTFAYRTAFHDLGIQIPRALSAPDRARVRYLIADRDDWAIHQSLRNWARAE